MSAKVRTCLAFRDQAEEAAGFYVSLIPGSEFETVFRPTPEAPALTAFLSLAGTPYQALNMGEYVALNEAVSISVKEAMMGMAKLDIAALEKAFRGE